MVILEALYYECKVVAWRAPGPNLTIDNGKTGVLVGSREEVIENILSPVRYGKEGHDNK